MKLLLTGQETKRLLFRKLKPSDFDAWLPFHENPLSTQYWNGLPKDPNVACQEWFQRVFYRYKHKLGGMNALIDRTSRHFIGQCGLLVQTVDGLEELEIGYSILPKYWKKGYASEAAQKCKVYAFENEFSKSLISIIHVDNIPSQKVAANIGMQLEKTTLYRDNPVHIFRIWP